MHGSKVILALPAVLVATVDVVVLVLVDASCGWIREWLQDTVNATVNAKTGSTHELVAIAWLEFARVVLFHLPVGCARGQE